MKIDIRQVRGGSGVDIWAQNLCQCINLQGFNCNLDLRPSIYQFVPALGKFKRDSGYSDLIHSNTWNGFIFQEECPLVVTEHLVVHDPAIEPYKSASQKLYHRWIYRCEQKSFNISDAIVCVSRYTQKKTEELFGVSDTIMVYNGIDSSFFTPREITRTEWGIPEKKCVLLFTGNLTRRKGADLLPEIMNSLGDQFLLLTTTGNRNRSYYSIPNSRNLGHINFEQLVQVYNLCDIFIIPSRLEGLSLSTLEAMSCGKPVMAFDCASFPELIIDGKGGFLCEMDNISDITDRIRYLAEDTAIMDRMGEYNRKRVESEFTLKRMVQDYLSLYKTLL